MLVRVSGQTLVVSYETTVVTTSVADAELVGVVIVVVPAISELPAELDAVVTVVVPAISELPAELVAVVAVVVPATSELPAELVAVVAVVVPATSELPAELEAGMLAVGVAVHLVQTVDVLVTVKVEVVEVSCMMVDEPEVLVNVTGQTLVVSYETTVVTTSDAEAVVSVVVPAISVDEPAGEDSAGEDSA